MARRSTSRLFLSAHVAELEREFEANRTDPRILRELRHELSYRTTARATALASQVQQALAALKKPVAEVTTGADGDLNVDPVQPLPAPLPRSAPRTALRQPPMPSLPPPLPIPEPVDRSWKVPIQAPTDDPASILDSWIALEVLAPQTFRHPKALVGGDLRAVANWTETLPWEGDGEKARPRTQLFYQVVLGTLDFGTAVERLLTLYTDSRVERPPASGEAILAAVTVDRHGRLVKSPSVAVSSFAWGLPRALQGDLTSLSAWASEEQRLIDSLDRVLHPSVDDEEDVDPLPLSRDSILSAYHWLIGHLGLSPELTRPPSFALRVYPYFLNPDPPEPLLLNSFFLRDLTSARAMLLAGEATPNLRLYLGALSPPQQRDLLRDQETLENAVAPISFPPARWPGKGRHPLVLLQQAAVNLAFQRSQTGGIQGINGPPGTGKTTLLRDLVAAVVTARAEAMATFDDPAEALTPSGHKLKQGQQSWLHLYRLDPRLRGFEMVVASSNNKAVENVSGELPAVHAITADEPDLRYFKTISDALSQHETWGLCAAVLGNQENRSRFREVFWREKDTSLATYLLEASGTPQVVEEVRPGTETPVTRPPRIVVQERPPKSHEEALRRWKKARKRLQSALSESRKMLAYLERVRRFAEALPTSADEKAQAETAAEQAANVLSQVSSDVKAARSLQSQAREREHLARTQLTDHDRSNPGLLARITQARSFQDWKAGREPLVQGEREAQEEVLRTGRLLAQREAALKDAVAQSRSAERLRAETTQRLEEARHEVLTCREKLGPRFVDEELWERDRDDLQTTPPWLTEEQHRLRDSVFTAAMALQRAFIDAAAKPLRHNLGILMSLLGGRRLAPEKQALIPDLWSSLFLVVPLVSTTFASVEKMFRDLPQESLGWLFVDEAGQAVPQAAVGALFRTRRAVIVGDPAQIEPIAPLPDRLSQAICRTFRVDPDRFNAPAASVQTLADAASPFLAEIEGRHGSRRVGAPLLVHRRCSEPMFGISNAVAYDHLMVQAKAEGHSPIGELLGPTRWIDVRGSAQEKWCPEEGQEVLSLLRRITHLESSPDLYIVTPFVVVAERLRAMVEASGLLGWTSDPRVWARERIGTIHTVQGREAEAVLFVLGAPAPFQAGARAWAGGRPNLLNVAVTRAKERLYVIGNRELWRTAGHFRELDARLPPG